jgi:hypothetical protein
MTPEEIITLIEADGLWVHPSGAGGWNVSPSDTANSACYVWNAPSLRAAVALYTERKANAIKELDL